MSSAAFPRGGLKSDETKDPKQEKKEKRKRKENDADLLATRKPAKRVDKAPAAEEEKQQQSTPLDVLTTTTIVKAARGKGSVSLGPPKILQNRNFPTNSAGTEPTD